MKRLLLVAGIAAACVSPAYALCSYGGIDSAKTTISREYRDSKWVVRARLISADNHLSDDDESWTLYNLQTIENFKGDPPSRFSVFTWRNSGGFYMDDGMKPDLGAEYLLFLRPQPKSSGWPAAARGASAVNYSCGQSKAWAKFTPIDIERLRGIAKQH